MMVLSLFGINPLLPLHVVALHLHDRFPQVGRLVAFYSHLLALLFDDASREGQLVVVDGREEVVGSVGVEPHIDHQ